MTIFMVIRVSGNRIPCNITVDGDLIVQKGLGGFRKVHRDGGLMLSDRGRFGTFMWGGVWIPRALPEYEYLKRVAEMWKAQEPEKG